MSQSEAPGTLWFSLSSGRCSPITQQRTPFLGAPLQDTTVVCRTPDVALVSDPDPLSFRHHGDPPRGHCPAAGEEGTPRLCLPV